MCLIQFEVLLFRIFLTSIILNKEPLSLHLKCWIPLTQCQVQYLTLGSVSGHLFLYPKNGSELVLYPKIGSVYEYWL